MSDNTPQTEIENAIIGSYLLDPERAQSDSAEYALSPEMFTTAAKGVFEIIQKLLAAKNPVDAITIGEKHTDPKIINYLMQCMDSTPTTAHIGYYALLLVQNHQRRELKKSLLAYINQLQDDTAEMVSATIITDLSRAAPTTSIKSTPMPQATAEAVSLFEQAHKGIATIKTGLPYLDSAGGFARGSLIVISGKAGSCKTTLARQILANVAGKSKIPSAFITLEMSESQIAAQSITDISNTSYTKFMRGAADQNDWTALLQAKAIADQWPLQLTASARTPAKVAAYTHAAVRKGVQFIVIDYLQALRPDPTHYKANIEQQTSHASATILDLAVTTGATIVVISTESREGELRYSDAIRYDAWLWLRMIQPEENCKDNPVFHLEVKKNRFGVIPSGVRPLYRVRDRLLTEEEWAAQQQRRR